MPPALPTAPSSPHQLVIAMTTKPRSSRRISKSVLAPMSSPSSARSEVWLGQVLVEKDSAAALLGQVHPIKQASNALARKTKVINGKLHAAVEVLYRFKSEPGTATTLGKAVFAVRAHDERLIGWYPLTAATFEI